MKSPKVTVLMPVYNGERYLREAIDSVLEQTFTDFEFLIINDGSKDKSEEIILQYTDPRIRYLINETNQGLSATLNRGLLEAKGEYIARLDCDDFDEKTRLQKQVAFLDENPEYGIVGSLFALIDEKSNPHGTGGMRLLDDEDMKNGLQFGSVFAHGETMFRRELLIKNNLFYDAQYTPCEDYELWVRLSKITKFKNLSEILYFYRLNPEGMSGTQSTKMQNYIDSISQTVREENELQKITLTNALHKINKGRSYTDEIITLRGNKIRKYIRLNYQIFLYRLSFLYYKKKRYSEGIALLIATIVISPTNCFRHFLRLFPQV